LAQAVATSPRTLLRHFASSQQQSPLLYLQGLRMARARVLLETTYLPVDQLALACGYTDAGTFRRHFLRAAGELPAAYRQHNRLRTSRARWLG
jgi:transcriptional regulator GlxA family with amidase domain